MKFRKKPVVIEAVKASDALRHAHDAHDTWYELRQLAPWLAYAYEDGAVLFLKHPDRVSIKTPEGWVDAMPDDWIIRGVAGEIYPCKPDIFEKTYEAVTEPQP